METQTEPIRLYVVFDFFLEPGGHKVRRFCVYFLTSCEALSLFLKSRIISCGSFFYFFFNAMLLFLLFFSCWKSLINEIDLKSKKGESGLSLYVAPLGHDLTNVTNVTACVISGCFFGRIQLLMSGPSLPPPSTIRAARNQDVLARLKSHCEDGVKMCQSFRSTD